MHVVVIKHRVAGAGDERLWQGEVLPLPSVGDRIVIPTQNGPRTYKVSRITRDLKMGEATLEVVKVESVYVD